MTQYYNSAIAALAALTLTLGVMAYAIVPAEHAILIGTIA